MAGEQIRTINDLLKRHVTCFLYPRFPRWGLVAMDGDRRSVSAITVPAKEG